MKINVIGTSGSGKTTLARRIADELAIPYIEMDRLYWRPNWQGTADDAFLEKLEHALSASQNWVLDGNYNRTRPVKWRNVDLVVWVDYGFVRTLYQAVIRASKRAGINTNSGRERAIKRVSGAPSSAESPLSSGRLKPGATTAGVIRSICKTRTTHTYALSVLPAALRRKRLSPP